MRNSIKKIVFVLLAATAVVAYADDKTAEKNATTYMYEHDYLDAADVTYTVSTMPVDMCFRVNISVKATKEKAEPRQTVKIWINDAKEPITLLDYQWSLPETPDYVASLQWPATEAPCYKMKKTDSLKIRVLHDTRQAKAKNLVLTVKGTGDSAAGK